MASALPEEQRFAVAVLQRWRKPVTARSVKNMIGWMRAEGGHWHNSARFNPLNTTQNMPGSGDTGSQGNISVYRDWNQGVDATVKTLNNGRYGAIAAAVNADPSTFARAVNSTPWGTKSNFGSISSGIGLSGNLPAGGPTRSAQSAGPVARDPGAAPSSAVPGSPSVQFNAIDGAKLMALLAATKQRVLAGQMPGSNYASILGKLAAGAIQQQPIAPQAAQAGARVAAQAPAAAGPVPAGVAMVRGAIAGSPVPGQHFHSTTHQTSGLPGYPAYDYMTSAGTPAVAPVTGTVFKLSGKSPRAGFTPGGPMGYSIYIQGTNGKKYFLTHLDGVKVKVGQRVHQGQQIAVVAAAPRGWSSPHVHMGVSG